MTHSEACEILRKQAVIHQGKFIQGVWLILFFVFAIALVGITDGMPLWEAGLACGVLGLLAGGLWLRGTGRWGVDVRIEVERWIHNPKLLLAYDSKKVNDGEDPLPNLDVSTGGTVHWRLRFHLAEGGWVSISMSQKEKRKYLQAMRLVFPDVKRRRISKKGKRSWWRLKW